MLQQALTQIILNYVTVKHMSQFEEKTPDIDILKSVQEINKEGQATAQKISEEIDDLAPRTVKFRLTRLRESGYTESHPVNPGNQTCVHLWGLTQKSKNKLEEEKQEDE